MNLIRRILSVSSSVQDLDNFISKNILEITDYPNLPFDKLKLEKDDVNGFLTKGSVLLRGLDYTKDYNQTFLLVLFQLCEKFSFINVAFIMQLINNNNIDISDRIKASRLFLSIHSPKQLISRFHSICEILNNALESEEDNDIKINLTFSNYILFTIKNAQKVYIVSLGECLKEVVKQEKYYYINNSEFLQKIINLDFSSEDIEKNIYSAIDDYILKVLEIPLYNKDSLIEVGTDYAKYLKQIKLNFQSVREISVRNYLKIADNQIYRSLNRGVSILQNPEQLLAYMYSFGNMHYEKLVDSFKTLPDDFFQNKIQIIDWGCGQGMATMVFYDYLSENEIECDVERIILIEPSEIALKRGALHSESCFPHADISTIHSDINSLDSDEIYIMNDVIYLHLFSNILDVDNILLNFLSEIIVKKFIGNNYFICASPFVNTEKKERLNNFKNYFQKFDQFEEFENIDSRAYEWKKDWTRVIRVFKCTI